MRYDADHKRRTRERVLDEAGQALRAAGPERLSVAEVMSRAGLTHGGFYAHFASKDALVCEAIDAAFADARAIFERASDARPPREALSRYLAAYLSERHRDAPDRGCPLPALAADLPRMSPQARERFAAGVERLTARVAALLGAAEVPDGEGLASSVVAELVGALSLSRAVGDPARSRVILDRSREALSARLGLEPVT